MPNVETGNAAFYRNRAIVRKIMREGTGLMPERMTTKQLNDRISIHSSLIFARLTVIDHTDVELARAVVELEDCCSELVLRGAQLALPLDC